VALPGNQAVNGENKHQPVYRKKPVYSTPIKLAVRPHRESCYVRFSGRGAIDFPLVGVAIGVEKDDRGVVRSFCLAATGIQSRPVRLQQLEEALAGISRSRELTQKIISLTHLSRLSGLGVCPGKQ